MWKDVGEAITALVPFGVAGLAIAAIVVLILFPKNKGGWAISFAMILIAAIFALDRYIGTSPEAAWFDTTGSADWGGQDLAYTAGWLPLYKSAKGETMCDTNLEGNVVTCWDNRIADGTSLDPKVTDTNVPMGSKKWCAYKDASIRVTTAQNGLAPKGKVYVCGRYVRRN
jgi:hypothetical protein